MKITKTLTALAALALVAIVAAPGANAVCALPYNLTSFPSLDAYSYIYTPGICDGGYPCPNGSSMTPGARGVFWSLGSGDPAVGLGNDNGALEAVVASYPGAYTYGFLKLYPTSPVLLRTDWNQPGIDGCALELGVPLACVGVLLTDQDAAGNGYFLMQTIEANANNNFEMLAPGGGGALTLAPLPRPGITGSTRIDAGTVQLDLAPPNLQNGLVLDPDCEPPLVGYRILSQAVASGAQPPSSRDIADWTDLSPAVVPPGTGTSVQVTCSGDQDIYLTTAIDFDSGYRTTFVSTNSTRVECGPNLADPIQQRPRLRPGGSIDMRDRGGKGGR